MFKRTLFYSLLGRNHDHTLCGLCNVSFYVARRLKEWDGKVYTIPGDKVTGAAYDEANISHMLGTGPSKEAICSGDSHGDRYPFFESRS
jgi:hypothetical protein